MRQSRSAVTLVAAAAAAGLLSGLAVLPAWATGPAAGKRVVVEPGTTVVLSGPGPVVAPQGPPANRTPRRRHAPSPPHPVAVNPHNFGPSYPFGYNYAGPSYPFGSTYKGPSYPFGNSYYSAPARLAPVHVAPTHRPSWVPGYWAREWVPQYVSYDAWVPGYFRRDGAWIQGYYGTSTVESGGYYQQVWVDGYWTE